MIKKQLTLKEYDELLDRLETLEKKLEDLNSQSSYNYSRNRRMRRLGKTTD